MDKKKKWKVIISAEFLIEADTKKEAEYKAETQFVDEINEATWGLSECMNSKASKI